MSLSLIATLIVLSFVFCVLALCFAVQSVKHHLDHTAQVLREQWNEDLRWHRESLLAHQRLEQAHADSAGSKR